MSKKILIADDSAFIRLRLKDLLASQYEIVEASDGVAAERKIKEEKPDLVLLDIIMPGGDEEGIAVLKKAIRANPDLKFVMITAAGQDAIKDETGRLGAVDFIVKPFDEADVIRTVQKHLG